MAWPAGMPLVTITQDVHKLPDGSLPSSYAVHLQLSVPALVFDGQTTLIRRSITLTAEAGSGVISEQVPHLNHPDLSPTPVYYMVTEFADGQRVRDPWQLTPAADDVTIDLDARAPIAGDPGTPVAVGPPGPTAVSEDAGNIATLGTDGLLLVDGVAVETAVEDYLAENPVVSATFKEVSNRTGAAIPAGTLVEIDGAFGIFSTVRVADNTTADHVAGITVAEIADGASGDIQVTGTVEGLNTSAFTAGAPLYLGTSGAWTETRPTAPAHIIRVGVAGVTHATAGTVVFTLPAFEILAENVDGLDAKVAELAEDPASELGVSLSSTYVAQADLTVTTGASVSGDNTGDQDLSGLLTTAAAPELIRDTMGSALVAGDGVTITPDDGADTITIAASGGGSGGITTALYLLPTDYVSTPASAGFALASADIRLRHTGTWTGNNQTVYAGWMGAAGNRSWQLTVGAAYFRIAIYGPDDTTAVNFQSNAHGLTNGQTAWVRIVVTFPGDDTVGAAFYKSTDGTTWTAIGTGSTPLAGATALFNSTAALKVGAGTTVGPAGLYHEFELRNAATDTIVARWDGRTPHTRQRDIAGNIWTVNGTANAWQVVE